MEEFATAEEGPSEVTCAKPPKGMYFTVRAETGKPWQDRSVLFPAGDRRTAIPTSSLPISRSSRKEEDVIRPVLMVRYVTMAGEEGLWPLKLDPPDGKSNAWNRSALNVLQVASEGKWVRLMSAKGHYHLPGIEEDVRRDTAALL